MDALKRHLQICIDRGGTFTDCVALDQRTGRIFVEKLLSEDPRHYADAPREGIRRLLERITGETHAANVPLDTSRIVSIRMATTVATNALLERKGEPFALFITRGFRDLLEIGNQSRPDLFTLNIRRPSVLYNLVEELEERVTPHGSSIGGHRRVYRRGSSKEVKDMDIRLVENTGEHVRIVRPLNESRTRLQLERVRQLGIQSVAVCCLHSTLYPEHEKAVGKLAREVGLPFVTLSGDVVGRRGLVGRGQSACVEAYLVPKIQEYLSGFTSGLDMGGKGCDIWFMHSDGGLVSREQFSGVRAILSGPAAGVVGTARTAFSPQRPEQPVIGFDMGGTSTDVSRYAGSLDIVFESQTAGLMIHTPQLEVVTVAAGGGSQLFFRHGMLVVGPESAGAHPGPACYRKGGPLTVTDANLVLGRLLPEFFPKIFGPEQNEQLNMDASMELFQQLLNDVNRQPETTASMTVYDLAHGFIRVANETMSRAIREVTQSKGWDVRDHILACFGGAGGQHACAMARILGIKLVKVHRLASVLSAFGLLLADVTHECAQPSASFLDEESWLDIRNRLSALGKDATSVLHLQGFSSKSVRANWILRLRYQGTDTALSINCEAEMSVPQIQREFEERYVREFGFLLDRPLIVDELRSRAVGKSEANLDLEDEIVQDGRILTEAEAVCVKQVYFIDRRYSTAVFHLDAMKSSERIHGPAIILDRNSTIVVEPNCTAIMSTKGNIWIEVGSVKRSAIGLDLDPIQLSIFSHRFMGIAEQMGRTLQKTSISTNIKERLDFSCALFCPKGGLVANAPHIPVHLGSMQEAVRYQMNLLGDDMKEGDVIVTNHPSAGGSHLPDITVITPVFFNNMAKPVFFVASRGHHADIGGITPGSMPPHSKWLYEEGAAIKSFKIVKQGVFQEEGITKILLEDPAKYPNCSGTRNLQDNISDLRAQVAANNRGIQLVQELMKTYGLDVVHAYMQHIQDNAEKAVRSLLKDVHHRQQGKPLHAIEYMDDGTPIVLKVTIDPVKGDAVMDFTGTGEQVLANWNAPKSVTHSAVIYCLRCMVADDIPLNQGCLNPIEIIIPQYSLLQPSSESAVVGGNVVTSQRVVDVILRAFEACAASQGCMNNLTFGMPTRGDYLGWGYYETIAGGSGAGPGWHGISGVHTHMTNTRMTDPEILESRYPVMLRQFSFRENSGGAGKYKGGCGLVRDLEFLEPMSVSLLSERRVYAPYGLKGGADGAKGKNIWIKKLSDGSDLKINIGGKNTMQVGENDRLVILTPGGGGYGSE